MNEEAPSSAAESEATVNEPTAGEAQTDELDVADGSNRPPRQDQGEPRSTPVTIGATLPSPARGSAPAGQLARKLDPSTVKKLDPSTVDRGWWPFAILLLAIAVLLSVLVALATGFSHAHRVAAALVALLDLAALATLAHVTLLWYQSKIVKVNLTDPSQPMLAFRRRGLKAAVMGEDGRASTSKTQVVIWTGAMVWALVDLLLLAGAFPGGNLFTAAVGSNWRPEYLALLGLPVAAAVIAKAAVVSSNGGLGPQEGAPDKAAEKLQVPRVYVRNPVPEDMGMGFANGLAELITSDDGSVAWADLQYIVFTLITLVYFVIQLLTQPKNGLPPVPAALLTLMGVSASAYTANKIVDTKGAAPHASAAPTAPTA